MEFWGHSYPLGGPQHQQGQGLNLDFFHRRDIVRHSRISYLNFFLTPQDICVNLAGGPQHQQGQSLELFQNIVRNSKILELFQNIVRNSKISGLKLFLAPQDIWVEFWGHPHGGP